MTYASIAVAVSGARDDGAAISAACELAKRHCAIVTVVIVVPQLNSAVGLASVGGARMSAKMWEALSDGRRQTIESTAAIVRDQAAHHGLTNGESNGPPFIVLALPASDPVDGLKDELPLTDLVVTAHSAARGQGPWTGLLADALMVGRAPVLIAGERGLPAAEPAAVAWDGSEEAGRAVRAAVPLLREASRVAILQDAEELGASAGPTSDPERLVRYLSAQGVQNAEVFSLKGSKAGPTLLRTAHDLGASLLVAGAFGHARLTETLFGGATRTFLHTDESLHLFLSH